MGLASNSIKEAPLAATHRISGPNVASLLLIAQILLASFIKLQASRLSCYWLTQPLLLPSRPVSTSTLMSVFVQISSLQVIPHPSTSSPLPMANCLVIKKTTCSFQRLTPTRNCCQGGCVMAFRPEKLESRKDPCDCCCLWEENDVTFHEGDRISLFSCIDGVFQTTFSPHQ